VHTVCCRKSSLSDFVGKTGLGNQFRVLAVANPDLSFAEYRKHRPERGQGIEDARLRADGYGIVRVDKKAREFVLECWPAGNNPAHPGNRQFGGWPLRVKFANRSPAP
jgi:alkaline phosphatase D